MKKLFKKEENYENLRQKYYKIKKRKLSFKWYAIIFSLFVFVVNAYAWFVYISEANVKTDAAVAGWDLNFLDGTNVVKYIHLNPEIYPGMQTFTKSIEITNASDVEANLTYEIKEVNFSGELLYAEGTTNEVIENNFENKYPFTINLGSSKETLGKLDNANFTVEVSWPYENSNQYFQIPNIVKYDSSFDYYELINGIYQKKEGITQTNFDILKTNLYMKKDDIDSYLGETCGKYQKENNKPCLNFRLILKATQRN